MTDQEREQEMPADEAPPGAESTAEDLCPACGGSGQREGGPCPECGGRGRVVEAVGGG
jgi:DnaJ-class molecular chaperone